MPTYKNETAFVVATEGFVFQPGQSHMTRTVLEDVRLTKTSDEPYYNPTVAIHEITSTGAADDQEITLDPITSGIKIWKVSGAVVDVFLNSLEADITAKLEEDYEVEIAVKGYVTKVILQFSHGGTCELIEVR
jgi:hypothetical protein